MTTIPTTMTIEACAKVNLTLEVYGTRPDGYHVLRSVVAPVSLSDTLVFEPAPEFSTDTGYKDDLILKAVDVLRSDVERWNSRTVPKSLRTTSTSFTTASANPSTFTSFHVSVTKRIPAGGGLGGGSADAAATLRALNELWHLGRTPEELAALGAAVGSDVPALVLAQATGDAVLMEGRGETVSPFHLPRPLDLVLVFPGVFSSTPKVFAACAGRSSDDPSVLAGFRSALVSADPSDLARAFANDLESPAVRLYPEIGAARAAVRAAGALGAAMSGSGSTVFGFAADPADAAAIASRLAASGFSARAVRAF